MRPGGLTPLQVQATRLFFSLPESVGFAVAGGAARIARGLIHRPTRDVDLFLIDADAPGIALAVRAFETAIGSRGWSHRRVIDQGDFVRLAITSDQEPHHRPRPRQPGEEPPDATDLGPTLSSRDLAARKTLAPFGRAEARDFADVFELARSYGRGRLLGWATADDSGFDTQVFADMLASIGRLADEDFPVEPGDAPALRAYFRDWAAELTRP
jgi:hypothetical protein